jgi:hypothetical protein
MLASSALSQAAGTRGNGQFANDLGEDLAAPGIGHALPKSDVLPFGMTGHVLVDLRLDAAEFRAEV